MPLFGSKPGDGAAAWEPRAAAGRGGQPAGAASSGVFPSDLSVSEYVLLGEAGFEPLGFVVGSSIYHIGLQIGRWSQNQELQVLTQAMYNARELAMTRMQAEADHLGADGIVGVQLRIQSYVWGQGVLEFIATGTAVRALGTTGRATQAAHPNPPRREPPSGASAMSTGPPNPRRSPPLPGGSTAGQPTSQASPPVRVRNDRAVAAFAHGQADRPCGACRQRRVVTTLPPLRVMVIGSVPALPAPGPDGCAGDPETLPPLGPTRDITAR